MSLSSVIGALRVNLSLDSAEFSTGLQKSQSQMKQFGKTMAVAGAGITAIGVGVAASVKSQLATIDTLGKTAANLGVPVDELARLRHAADMSGASATSLDGAIRKLSRGMIDTPEKFKEFGIAVRDANGNMRPTSDIMDDLADKMAAMPTSAARTAMAMELMGKTGTDLVSMLYGGSDALKSMKAEADSLGIVISQEQANNAAMFNDNLSRLAKQAGSFATMIAANLAPTLVRISDAVVAASEKFRGMSPAMQSFVSTVAGATLVVGPLLSGLGLLVMTAGPIVAAMARAGVAVGGAGAALAAKSAALTTTTAALTTTTAATTVATAATGRLTASTIAGTAALRAKALAAGFLTRALALVGGPIGLITLGVAAVAAKMLLWPDAADNASAALERHGKIVDRIKARYAEIGGEVQNWSQVLSETTELQAKQNLEELIETQRKARAAMMKGVVNDLALDADLSKEDFNVLRGLRVQFEDGQLTIDQLKTSLSQLAAKSDEATQSILATAMNAADAMRPGQTAVNEAQALVVMLDSAASAADRAAAQITLGLNSSLLETVSLHERAATAAQNLKTAAEGTAVAVQGWATDVWAAAMEKAAEAARQHEEAVRSATEQAQAQLLTQQQQNELTRLGMIFGQDSLVVALERNRIENQNNVALINQSLATQDVKNQQLAAARAAFEMANALARADAAGGGVQSRIMQIRAGLSGAIQQANALAQALSNAAGSFGSAIGGLGRLGAAAKTAAAAGSASVAAVGAFAKPLGNIVSNAIGGMMNAADEAIAAGKTLEDFKPEPVADVKDPGAGGGGGASAGGGGGAASAVEKLTDAQREAERVEKSRADALKRLQDEHERYRATLGMTEQEERVYQAVQEAGVAGDEAKVESILRLIIETDHLKKQQEEIRELNSTLETGFRDVFGAAIKGAGEAGDAVGKLLDRLSDMVLDGAFDMLWKGTTSGFGGVGGLLRGFVGGDGGGSAGGGGGIGGFFSNVLGSIGRNANGTPGWSGGLTWVGERGPELVNLSRGSQVLSNPASRRMVEGSMGGGINRVEIDLGPGLEARIISRANDDAFKINKAALDAYDTKQAPRSSSNFQRDPRVRG